MGTNFFIILKFIIFLSLLVNKNYEFKPYEIIMKLTKKIIFLIAIARLELALPGDHDPKSSVSANSTISPIVIILNLTNKGEVGFEPTLLKNKLYFKYNTLNHSAIRINFYYTKNRLNGN